MKIDKNYAIIFLGCICFGSMLLWFMTISKAMINEGISCIDWNRFGEMIIEYYFIIAILIATPILMALGLKEQSFKKREEYQ